MAYTRADKERNSLPSIAGANLSAQNINIDDIVYHLNLALHEPQPKHFFDLWRKERRATLNSKQIDALHGLIDKVLDINQKATQAQAELQVAPHIVKNIIENNLLQAKQETELMIAQHQDRLHEIKDRMDARKSQLQSLENANKVTEANIAHIKAQIANLEKQGDAIAYKIRNTEMSGAELASVITSLKDNKISEDVSRLTHDLREQEAIYAERMAKVGVIMQQARYEEAKANREFVQADLDGFTRDETIRPNTHS